MDDVALGLQCLLVVECLQPIHIVFQVEQMALLLFIDDLLSRKGCKGLGIPVHHAESAIDEAFVIEVNENLDYTL